MSHDAFIYIAHSRYCSDPRGVIRSRQQCPITPTTAFIQYLVPSWTWLPYAFAKEPIAPPHPSSSHQPMQTPRGPRPQDRGCRTKLPVHERAQSVIQLSRYKIIQQFGHYSGTSAWLQVYLLELLPYPLPPSLLGSSLSPDPLPAPRPCAIQYVRFVRQN